MRRIFYEIFKLIVKIDVTFIYILKKKLLADFIINKIINFLQFLFNLSSFYILINSLL